MANLLEQYVVLLGPPTCPICEETLIIEPLILLSNIFLTTNFVRLITDLTFKDIT